MGDREAHLRFAAQRLSGLLTDLAVSPFHEYDPVGVPTPQPPYLNAAAVGRAALGAAALVERLLGIEAERGRTRPSARAPRTLDLDLILYEESIVSAPGCQVPHPRFRERLFVLEPLAEIAAEMRDPVTGLTVGKLLERLRATGVS